MAGRNRSARSDSHQQNEEDEGEFILDDGSSHCYKIRDTEYYTCVHMSSRSDGPSKILNHVDRTVIAPKEFRYCLYENGNTQHYTSTSLDEIFLKKFQSIFCKDRERQPWLLTNLHEDCVENREFYTFLKRVNRWCLCKKYSFLFIDYSYEKHLESLEFDLDKLRKVMRINEKEDPKNRVLIYIAELEIIFNIRYVDAASSSSKKEISDAVKKGQVDTKLFSILHTDIIGQHGISFVSVVAANGVTDAELLVMDLCSYCTKNLIMTSGDLTHYGKIDNKLRTIIRQRDDRRWEDEKNLVPHKSAFECLASRIWGCLSVRDVTLPNIAYNAYNCLVRIYLNNDQRHFLQCKEKHVILQGGYGSGKSILAQYKFKEVVQRAGNDVFYYICYANETLYKDVVASFFAKSLKHRLRVDQVNVMSGHEYCMKYGLLQPLMVSDILRDVKERHEHCEGKPNVFIDEFDGSNMTFAEGVEIRTNLAELKDSYIWIVMQSMETTRKRIMKEGVFSSTRSRYDGYHYKITGMHIQILDLIMRNSTKINDLARTTIRTLVKHKNVFCDREERIPAEPVSSNAAAACNTEETNYLQETKGKDEVEAGHKTNKEAMIYFDSVVEVSHKRKKEARILSDTAICNMGHKPKKEARKYSESTSSKESNGFQETKGREQVEAVESKILSSVDEKERKGSRENEEELQSVSLKFDLLLKQIDDKSRRKTGTKIESKFHFPGEWEHGHAIEGQIPQIIYPFADQVINYDNINEPGIKNRMYFTIQEIVNCSIYQVTMAVICFDLIDSQLFHSSLKAMNIPVIVYTPAIFSDANQKSTEEILELMKTHVIITDHIGARGLEFQKVVVSLDPNENYLHQYLVEAFTRCIDELFFTIIRKEVEMKKGKVQMLKSEIHTKKITSGHIIRKWKKKGLVEKHVVHMCSTHIAHDCMLSSACGENNVHYVHAWHEQYQYYREVEDVQPVITAMGSSILQYELLSNTHHLDELVLKKREKQILLQEFSRKGISYLEDLFRNKDDETFALLEKLRPEEFIRARDDNGNSLLHLAAKYDLIIPIRLMVAGGLIDIPNMDGYTSLMMAIVNESKTAIKYLFEQGADLLKVNTFGYNVMDLARDNGNEELVALVEQLSAEREERERIEREERERIEREERERVEREEHEECERKEREELEERERKENADKENCADDDVFLVKQRDLQFKDKFEYSLMGGARGTGNDERDAFLERKRNRQYARSLNDQAGTRRNPLDPHRYSDNSEVSSKIPPKPPRRALPPPAYCGGQMYSAFSTDRPSPIRSNNDIEEIPPQASTSRSTVECNPEDDEESKIAAWLSSRVI